VFDPGPALRNLLVMAVAYGLAVPIGWNRERERAGAGLRTFPLVGRAALGGGAILKNGGNVQGTATAASLWTTGAMGAAVALGRYEIAALLTLVVWLTSRTAPTVKPKLRTQANDGKESQHA